MERDSSPNHLIIVCGHAIWLGGAQKGHDESEWLIESYKRGETPTFIEHIKAGLKALGEDHRSVLAFSGGPTRAETPLSEARSYANLAAANGYFNFIPSHPAKTAGPEHELSPIPLSPRIILEEQALDSYYNVLFSVVAFWRRCNSWPNRLTIVSHAFKRARIVDAHCGAIRFPLDRVSFIGINPPHLPPSLLAAQNAASAPVVLADDDANGGSEDAISLEKAEAMRGINEVIGQWMDDPHGVSDALAGKRKARNPWNVSQLLFAHEDERLKSGVETRIVADGTEALAVGDIPRPGTAWRI